jgi:tripartite-type tricarboxylate transporter receptor subunit TctC
MQIATFRIRRRVVRQPAIRARLAGQQDSSGGYALLRRRSLIAAPLAAALPLAALSRPALAQTSWPDRPLRIVVGYPPGGSLDVLTRVLAEQLSQRLGQPVVVENRAGAGGNLAPDALAKAAPDGYTIACAGIGIWVINQHLYPSMPFEAQRDLLPLSMTWEFPNVAVVPAQHVPARNVQEFVAWAKQRRDGISYGSPGVGTTPHLSAALFMERTGVKGVHIPFRGAAQTIPAMLSGDVQFALDNLASYIPVIQEGRMRALAVTSAERWPTLPDVPTMKEAGLDDFVVASWTNFAVPAATPRPIVDRLSTEIRRVTADPALRQRALGMGAKLLGSTPEEALAYVRSELPKWQEMVRISGARMD